MTFGEALKTILRARGYTQREFGEMIGVKQGSISSMMAESTPRLNTTMDYLEPLGYRVAFVPVGSKLPDGSFVIDEKGPGRSVWGDRK